MNVHAQSLHYPRMACWSLWYLDPNLAGGFLNTHVFFHPNSWQRGQLKLTQVRHTAVTTLRTSNQSREMAQQGKVLAVKPDD